MGLVDTLKREFDLSVEWLGFEIHPDTPPEGIPLSTMFPHVDAESMTRRLNSMGDPFGITFQRIVRIANSRLALEAGEFAKDHGRFDQFHRAVFAAYFSRAEDIGNVEILKQAGREAGLDAVSLETALQTGQYRPALENMRKEAARLDVNAAPTFILEETDRVVGAQSLDVFREKLRGLRSERSGS
jgi:predicted DsbA family dithiol-disulfide isomerase